MSGISVPLAAALGFAIHLVLLWDHLFFARMQLRWKFSHLLQVRHLSSYFSSAKALGLKRLILGTSALFIVHMAGYLLIYRHFHPVISLIDVGMILGVGVVTFLCANELPGQWGYAIHHPFFLEQMKLFQRKKQEKSALAWTFPLEAFHLLDENYPLLRVTRGFDGEKQFDIKIGPQEKPHVILLFLESFSHYAIGYEKKATPHFDQLCREGILFSNFYSNGTFTYRALLAGLFGIAGGETTKGLAPYLNVPYRGLPQLMKKAGYTTAFFHNGSLNFDHQRQFLKNHFDVLSDRKTMEESPYSSTSWGTHDEHLMQYTVQWLEKQKTPALMTLFTISNHHPWITPEHHVSPSFDAVLNPSHRRFLQTLHYTDHCLGLLMQLLREKNLSQKTIVVVVGDHSQPLGQHHNNFYYSRFLYEENVRVPLLIVADGRISQPQTIEEMGSHVDLLPTLMDLLHLQGVQHGCGTSLLRKHSDRKVLLNNPYAEGFLGCRKGPWKWIENQLTQEEELYHLIQDPQEKNNLVLEHPVVAKQLSSETRNHFSHLYDLHRKQQIVPTEEIRGLDSPIHFDFSRAMITDRELIEQITPHIEKINLRDCLLITDESVSAILSRCPFLEELNLKGVTDITDAALELEISCTRLQSLDISDADISDRGLEKIIQACPHLSFLSLSGKNLTDPGIRSLGHCCHLVRLKILQAGHLSEEALIGVIKNNKHLGHLVIQGGLNLTDRFLEALKDYPLELLSIFEAPLLTDKGMAHLTKLPLRFLTVEGSPLLTQKSLSHLSTLNLESAYLNCQGLVHL